MEESLSNPQHPFSWNFTCEDKGALNHLPQAKSKKSRQFHADHYCAEGVKLALIGPVPLSVTQAKICELGLIGKQTSPKRDWGSISLWTDR